MHKNRWLILVLLISFTISAILAFVVRHPFDKNSDAYGYDKIGWNLASGRGYTFENNRPTMFREPAYPSFLALVYLGAGHNHTAARFVQIFLFLGTVLLTYKTATMIFNEKFARIALVITAFFPTLANYPAYLISETLFVFLLSLFVFFCVKMKREAAAIYFIASGLTLGILILCKIIMFPFFVLLAAWGLFYCRKTLKTIVMLAICLTLVMSWMFRNYLVLGTFTVVKGRSEGALCIKVQKLDYTVNDFKKALAFTISEYLGSRIYPAEVVKPRDFLFKEDTLVREVVLPRLKREGYTDKEIRKLMLSKIRRRPLKFLAISCLDLLRLTQFSYLPTLNQPNVIKAFMGLPRGAIVLALYRAIFRLLAPFLIMLSVYGMIITRSSYRDWIFIFAIMVYFMVMYSLVSGHGRYAVPIIPYFNILAAPAISNLIGRYGGQVCNEN